MLNLANKKQPECHTSSAWVLLNKKVITKFKTNPFSLIIDETTDRSTKTQLAILGTYFDEENFKLDTFLIDLITLPN
jgi:hypothetical protein